MPRIFSITAGAALGAFCVALAAPGAFAANDLDAKELLSLSLEQLSNIEVTSVSKKSEKASEAASAIYVITQDDIRRSGMTSIPELLRMVPGLSVAQAGSHEWAITSRGTSNQFANKLLVLIDGRSVYTPIFSGVYWDIQDVVLQDIERIEVIRGPGATLWGANAVNGVINIITKSAKDTQGSLLSASAGNLERSLNTARHGAKLGENTYARAYAKYDDRGEFRTIADSRAHDAWNKAQSGFRVDGKGGESMEYTLQGDAYRFGGAIPLNLPNAAGLTSVRWREAARGGNVLGRFNFKQSEDSQWTLQTYFDNAQRRNFIALDTNTLDMDLQHVWSPHERHEIVWGVGYRLVSNESKGSFYAFGVPPDRRDNLFSGFVQDKIALVPDQFYLTLGSKFEHNDYTGFETQPSARLTWLVDAKQTLWAAASHAVRTPNIFADDGTLLLSPLGGGIYVAAVGNPDTEAETLNAYEIGYRVQPARTVSLDTTAFYNDYGKLITNSVGALTPIEIPGYGTTLVLPISPVNGNSGTTSGLELAANWAAAEFWQLSAAYTRLNFTLKNPESAGFTVKGNSPKDQFNVRSILELPHDLELTNALYYVDKLEGPNVPSYVRFDARLNWKPLGGLELSLVGQNLFDSQHLEFPGFIYHSNAQVPRSVYGNITWKF